MPFLNLQLSLQLPLIEYILILNTHEVIILFAHFSNGWRGVLNLCSTRLKIYLCQEEFWTCFSWPSPPRRTLHFRTGVYIHMVLFPHFLLPLPPDAPLRVSLHFPLNHFSSKGEGAGRGPDINSLSWWPAEGSLIASSPKTKDSLKKNRRFTFRDLEALSFVHTAS